MVLSVKQRKALQLAPPEKRAALRRSFGAARPKARQPRKRTSVATAVVARPSERVNAPPPANVRNAIVSIARHEQRLAEVVHPLVVAAKRERMVAFLTSNAYSARFASLGCPPNLPFPLPTNPEAVGGAALIFVRGATVTSRITIAAGDGLLVVPHAFSLSHPVRCYTDVDAGVSAGSAFQTDPDSVHTDSLRSTTTTTRDRLIAVTAGSAANLATHNVAFRGGQAPYVYLMDTASYASTAVRSQNTAADTLTMLTAKLPGDAGVGSFMPVQHLAGCISIQYAVPNDGTLVINHATAHASPSAFGHTAPTASPQVFSTSDADHQHGQHALLRGRLQRMLGGTQSTSMTFSQVASDVSSALLCSGGSPSASGTINIPISGSRSFFLPGDIDPAAEATGTANTSSANGFVPHNLAARAVDGYAYIANPGTTSATVLVTGVFTYACAPAPDNSLAVINPIVQGLINSAPRMRPSTTPSDPPLDGAKLTGFGGRLDTSHVPVGSDPVKTLEEHPVLAGVTAGVIATTAAGVKRAGVVGHFSEQIESGARTAQAGRALYADLAAGRGLVNSLSRANAIMRAGAQTPGVLSQISSLGSAGAEVAGAAEAAQSAGTASSAVMSVADILEAIFSGA